MEKAKLKGVLSEIVESMGGVTVIPETARRWQKELEEALPDEPVTLCMGKGAIKEPSKTEQMNVDTAVRDICSVENRSKSRVREICMDMGEYYYQKGKDERTVEILDKLESLPETTGCIGIPAHGWCCNRHFGQNDIKSLLTS